MGGLPRAGRATRPSRLRRHSSEPVWPCVGCKQGGARRNGLTYEWTRAKPALVAQHPRRLRGASARGLFRAAPGQSSRFETARTGGLPSSGVPEDLPVPAFTGVRVLETFLGDAARLHDWSPFSTPGNERRYPRILDRPEYGAQARPRSSRRQRSLDLILRDS